MSAPAAPMFSAAAAATADALGLAPGRANLDVMGETLIELGRADGKLVVVTSDSRGSGKLTPFGAALPRQIVELGIAEQNLVGVASGLAAAGKTVFAVSPACFLTARSLEQIKNDVAYSDHPVVLVGISAGVSYGPLGATHHSLHDLAVLRAIPNLVIVVPADNFEARAAVKAAAALRRPVYLRFGKAPMRDLPAAGFAIGRARIVREGNDAAFIATGETVVHALLAAERLAREDGAQCRVLSVPTIKPLDTGAILAAADRCRAVVTVEEHSIFGGLGEACAGLLAEAGFRRAFRRTGIPDEFAVTGSQAEIFGHYGLTMEGLADAMRSTLRRAPSIG